MEEGPKYDTDKAQWYPMPLVLLEPLRGPFLLGEQKYELFSCLKRFPDSDRRFWDAMMRHLTEFQLDSACYGQ